MDAAAYQDGAASEATSVWMKPHGRSMTRPETAQRRDQSSQRQPDDSTVLAPHEDHGTEEEQR